MIIIDDPITPPLYELDIDKAWSTPVRVSPIEDIRRVQEEAKKSVGYETPYMHPDRLHGILEIHRQRLLNEQQNLYAMIDAEKLELERHGQWVMKHRRMVLGSL